jgi:ribosomal protein S18 acetylase RimI-like enzyme
MGMLQSRLAFESEDPRSRDAQYCLDAYFAEIDSRFAGGFDRETGGAAALEDFESPNGCLMLVRLDGKPVGCGALRTLEPGIGEIKRMWVSPQARGLGVGRRLLEVLEQSARERGMQAVRLDTNASLSEALRLYQSAGYREIDRFNDNPYAQHWFEKTLT